MAELSNSSLAVGGQVLKDFAVSSDVSRKLEPEFGHEVARTIKTTWGGTTSYFYLRNTRFQQNRLIANGRMNMQAFVDQLQMNSKTNYININWQAIKLANTAISRLVGKWMLRGEKISVSAVDLQSKQDRQDAADQAEFVMDNKAQLAELEAASGVPMVPQDQFVANDKDELDEWVAEFNRIPQEIKYELGTNNILDANGWFAIMKDKILHDSAEVGLLATEVCMNNEGEIIVEWVRPENVGYSYSEYDDFRDTTYRFRIKSVKIGQLKKYWRKFGGALTDDQFQNLVQSAKEYQQYDKIRFLQEWNLFMYQLYDDWTVDLCIFYLKSLDSDDYTVTKTKIHNSTLIQKGNVTKQKENQSSLKDEKWNMYKGVYAMTADILLEWGLQENMIIPQDPKEIGNVEFPISLYMYQNYQMRNVAIPEKIQEPLEQMILARLRIQQTIARYTPSGYKIDVDAMQELDLGLAEMTTPMEAERIHMQTGRLYYRGRDAEGRPIPTPIQELVNSGFLTDIQGLITTYQFHYQVLKDELGNDPNLSMQAVQPRVTEGNVETARIESDAATDYIYDAYKHVMSDTGRKIACLLHKSVLYESKKYDDILKKDDVKGRDFFTKVEMMPTLQEQQKIEVLVNNLMAASPEMINFLDPFKISRVAKTNVKLAELLVKNSQKRFLTWQAEIATKNSQENAQIQAASMEAKAKSDNELADKQQNFEQRNIMLKGYFDLMSKGVLVDPQIQMILQGVVTNTGIPLMAENEQMKLAAMQAQQQAEQEQLAEQQQQQLPQEQPIMQEPPQEMAA